MITYIKIGLAIAVVAGAYAFGHSVATDKGEAALNKAKAEFSVERTEWANERTALSVEAAKALEAQVAAANTKEKEMRSAHRTAELKYQKRIKELEDARTKADIIIADTTPTGGLWINVEAATCTAPGSSQPRTSLSQATGSSERLASTLRCRIAEPDAKALVQIGHTADKRTELLNKCVATLNSQVDVLAPLDPVSTTPSPTPSVAIPQPTN